MAIWQFSFSLVPRQRLIELFGSVPSAITPDEFDAVSWWSEYDAPTLEQALDAVLTRGKPYTTAVPLWGTYDGNRLELVRDEAGVYAELSGRVDVRRPDSRFLVALVGLATSLDALFVDEEQRVLTPAMATMAEAIDSSRAAHYLKNPRAFFERLAGEDSFGECEGAT